MLTAGTVCLPQELCAFALTQPLTVVETAQGAGGRRSPGVRGLTQRQGGSHGTSQAGRDERTWGLRQNLLELFGDN